MPSNYKTSSLPPPDNDALAQSLRLVAVIRQEIDGAGGRIPFYRYMEQALYAPGLGYYSGGAQKFGKEGDFITAPELTPLFGQTVAAQAAEIMQMSAPAVIEAGAGSGVLAADMLLEFERLGCVPETYGILEISAELRARQRQTLSMLAPALSSRVVWLDAPPETFSGVVLANEVLDAMPAHLIVVREGEIFERGVTYTCSEGEALLAWADCPARGRVRDAALTLLAEGAIGTDGDYVTEINLAAAAWVTDWGTRLRHGALLLFDYGFPRDEFYSPLRKQGTLMCHYCHRAHDNPFLWPGLNDITCSVDFTAMAEAGFNAGLEVLGYTSQGEFLLNCGLLDHLARREMASDASSYAKASGAAQKLTQPREMGELFKVLALGRGLDSPLMGFAFGNRVHTL
ncbi:MAG: SAM-dependent methyltransferase [Azoarcus sp.]|jgi:SAM-dependent MidA family methyltransferase|nr:SAM-dependent methyltransferase [Azoarcus sp.]